jgi:hypothetical protein
MTGTINTLSKKIAYLTKKLSDKEAKPNVDSELLKNYRNLRLEGN